jgi:S1-C subfamily serine protease
LGSLTRLAFVTAALVSCRVDPQIAMQSTSPSATDASSVSLPSHGSIVSSAEIARSFDGAAAEIARRQVMPELRSPTGSSVFRANVNRVVLIGAGEDGFGSGVIVKDERTVLTNAHVVGDATLVLVFLWDPTRQNPLPSDAIPASVVGRDDRRDLVLLRLATTKDRITPASIAATSTLAVGSDVFAIGHPKGLLWSFTEGIVSQIRPNFEWNYGDGTTRRATIIQTQTAINPGSSGGALFDPSGQLVGITSFRADGEGLNFAIAGDELLAFLSAAEVPVAVRPSESEPKALRSVDLDGDGNPDTVEFDYDGDGRADLRTHDFNEDGVAERITADTDGDGSYDSAGNDRDQDGVVESYEFDNNADGKPDVRAFDSDRDGVLDRYERLP